MSNLIQIKRSLTSASPGSLANGEFGYTANGDVLYLGSNGTVVPIGGKRVPGTLTANQALVANSTSGIDRVIVANLIPIAVYANGSLGTAGQLLTSNGTAVHWSTPTAAVVGSNTQIQFNDSGSLGADAGLTFNKTTDTLTTNTVVTNTVLASATVNAAALTVGSSIVANTLGLFATGTVNATTVSVGTDVIGNSAGVFTAGTVNGAVISVGSSTVANSLGLFATGTVNAATLSVGSSVIANTTRFALGTATGFLANGTIGTAGQTLHSNGTTVYWATDDQGVTSVATGNGVTGGTITSTGTISVLANNGITANTSGLFVRAGTGVTVNATGVHIGQDVSTTSNVTFANVVTTGLTTNTLIVSGSVSSNLMPTTNNTFYLGNTTIKWAQVHAANVHGVTGIFDGNVEVAGNLIVTGNLVTTNVSSVIVSDAKILLAANNPGDILDIGFSGIYTDGASVVRHAGLFRDASDNGVFKFFANTTQDLTGNNVVNTTATGYITATLETYLRTTGITTNATHVAITANSTVNVAIVANTLTLATALVGTSGGTGRNTTTNNALLVGNSTNGYNTLSLGADGFVLQSNGTALVYDTLDGGTF